MNNEKPEFVDQLLAASIAHHASAEPRAGLEGRILAGVAARRQSAHRRAWALGLTAAALAAIAIVVAARFARHSSPLASQPPSIAVVHPPSRTPVASVAPVPIPVRAARGRRIAPPRPQQFPSPAPLSEQEKLLLLYVKETPRSVLAAPPATAETDLEIPALDIAALDIKELPRSQEEK